MAYSRYSPARPSFDTLGSSVGAAPFPGAGSGVGAGSAFGVGGGAGYGSSYGAGTGNGYGYGNGYGNGVGLEDEMTRLDDEGETVCRRIPSLLVSFPLSGSLLLPILSLTVPRETGVGSCEVQQSRVVAGSSKGYMSYKVQD